MGRAVRPDIIGGGAMNVLVNGDHADLTEGATVRDVVAELAASPRGVAVAINGEVVPRSTWDERKLSEGDMVEVLTAVGGG
jgi:sulfur carrier protein